MKRIVDDLRYGIRTLKTQPGFTSLVVLALAVGIGANCSLFTVANSLLLRPLPYQNPAELVEISLPQSRPPLEDLNRAQCFAGVAEFVGWGFNVAGAGGVQYAFGFRVSPNLFSVLGVRAAVGRIFSTGEDQPVVILGYDYWRRISGDPNIVGRPLVVSGEPFTVVGVLPADFSLGVRDGSVFVPNLRTAGRVVARLRPGVSGFQAQAEVASILRETGSQPAGIHPEEPARVTPLSHAFRNNDASAVLLLQATVGLVLLITCANVGNLMLARLTARLKEFAIRAAIGAGRWQLFSQLMVENALLGAAGGAAGLLLAGWSLDFVQANLPANIERTLRGADALSIDRVVLAFTVAISVLTVFLFGLAPAYISLRMDLMAALRVSAKGSTPGRERFGRVLVIAEVGLALMLLIGAGLTLKSLAGLQNANLGFSADHVLRAVVEMPASTARPEQRAAAYAEIVQRCEALPGVEIAGLLAPQFFPFGGPRVRGAPFTIRDRPEAEARAEAYAVNPQYFRSVRIPLVRGRFFTEADTAVSAPVALISQGVARRYWEPENPIGRLIRLQADREGSPWVSIVGIVGDVRNPVALDVQPTAYRPIAQSPPPGAVLMIRAAGDPLSLAEAVRGELRAVNPNSAFRPANLRQAVWDYVSPQRFTTSVLGFFAALGLLLATLGIYGVMRYWVVARISEIGMRIALGAQPKDVVWLVLANAGRTTLIGLALGIAGAFALQRVIASQLYGVSPTDLTVIAAVSALLGAVALGAALLPAWWAARIDPLVALRHE